MSRIGRPRIRLNRDYILALRRQGKSWTEVAVLVGHHRNTIRRFLSNPPEPGTVRMVCVGRVGDRRTALAIKRFKLSERRRSWDEWQEIVNELWREGVALGCPWCGLVRKLAAPDGLCSRHYRMNAAIRRIEDEVITQLSRLIYHAKVASNRKRRAEKARKQRIREGAARLGASKLSKTARLAELLRMTNERTD